MNNAPDKTLYVEYPIHIAMIATYPKMSATIRELVSGSNIIFEDIYASFREAVSAAKKIEHKTDIILTRGGTGHYIKSSVSIPVISMPITLFDLQSSISELPNNIEKIAFVNYSRALYGVDQIEKMYGKVILQYSFEEKTGLTKIAKKALADGCQCLIAGSECVKIAKSMGLDAIEISSTKESIYQALMQAIEIVKVNKEAQKQTIRLKSAFDSLSEGICLTNEHGEVSIFNPVAEKIFSYNEQQILGKQPSSVFQAEVFAKSSEDDKSSSFLETINDFVIHASRFPISLNGKKIGDVFTFQDVSKIQRLEGQIRQQLHKKGFTSKYHFDDIITVNPQMQKVKDLAKLYAQTYQTILIEGESGTGKELFAHSIHKQSPGSTGPFVTVNCAAIPEQLLESELFGYAPGAFTGAKKDGKAGLFEMAHNGTLFLDEIGEIPKYLQSRLLRVLQEKEVMRVGDDKIISIDCCIISATNQNLFKLVKENKFRMDLFYRLNMLTISVPPLRERSEDIPLLCLKFLDSNVSNLKQTIAQIQEVYRDYSWPGNVRELSNVCARVSCLKQLSAQHPSVQLFDTIVDPEMHSHHSSVTLTLSSRYSLKDMLADAEEKYLQTILKLNNNNHTATAKQLGIGRSTLWRKLEKEFLKETDGVIV
jgi:PAS domain S-box-containing protein